MKNFARINNYYNRIEAIKDWNALVLKAYDTGHGDLATKYKPAPEAGWRLIDKSIESLRKALQEIEKVGA